MIPSPEQLMQKRHAMLRRVRAWSLVLLVLASLPVSAFLVHWVCELSWPEKYSIEQVAMYFAMFFLPAVALRVLDRFLARRLVPTPEKRCPECGYSLEQLTVPRCPECGFPIPEVFVVRAPAAAPDAPRTDR